MDADTENPWAIFQILAFIILLEERLIIFS